MQVVRSLLHYRREHPDLFARGSYTPLRVAGPLAERFVAFAREHEGRQLVVIAMRTMDQDGVTDLMEICQGMTVTLARAAWREVISGRAIASESDEISLSAIFDRLPVVVLAAQ